MAETNNKINNLSLENRLTKLEAYIDNHDLHSRVLVLERWKAIIFGAAILVGSLITLFAEELKRTVM